MNTKPAMIGLLGVALLAGVASAHELKTVVNPPELANSLQYGYSQATVVSADAKLIHVAGREVTPALVEGSQARICLFCQSRIETLGKRQSFSCHGSVPGSRHCGQYCITFRCTIVWPFIWLARPQQPEGDGQKQPLVRLIVIGHWC